MRTLKQAHDVYFGIRRTQTPRIKRRMNVFEGCKFFRFGESWRRLSQEKTHTIILNDDSDTLVLVTPFRNIEIGG